MPITAYHQGSYVETYSRYKKLVRNLAVSVYNLIPSTSEQLELFGSPTHAVSEAMDKINDKWGEFVITPALMMGMDDTDFSARHSKRPSKRANGSRAMKVRETKEVLATISSACTSRHDWHAGKPGSSRFQDAQTRLRSARPHSQKPFDHKNFHSSFAWRPHESWP